MAPFLSTLSNDALHAHVLESRRTQAVAEWDLAMALLEVADRNLHLEHGCSSPTAYAVKFLELEAHKARELLRAVRCLQTLPLIREAFRVGRLGWGKLRAITRRVTPETETAWLDFALAHTQPEVEQRVVISPRGWKRLLADRARASEEAAAGVGSGSSEPAGGRAGAVGAAGAGVVAGAGTPGEAPAPGAGAPELSPLLGSGELAPLLSGAEPPARRVAPPAAPCGPTSAVALDRVATGVLVTVAAEQGSLLEPPRVDAAPGGRLAIEDLDPCEISWKAGLDPHQYAVVEQAERYVRARVGRRATRGEVLAEMARLVLKSAPSRTRIRYQVFVHVDGDSGQAWFDTERGLLPASAGDLEEITPDSDITLVPLDEAPTGDADAAESSGTGGSERAAGSSDPTRTERAAGSSDPTRTEGAAGSSRPSGTGVSAGRASRRPKSSRGNMRRSPVPVALIREVYRAARGRCQCCGSRTILHLDHEEYWCDTRRHRRLRLLCAACHSLRHLKDFEQRADWRQARDRAMAERKARSGEAGPPSLVDQPGSGST